MNNFKVERQHDCMQCGIACLQMYVTIMAKNIPLIPCQKYVLLQRKEFLCLESAKLLPVWAFM